MKSSIDEKGLLDGVISDGLGSAKGKVDGWVSAHEIRPSGAPAEAASSSALGGMPRNEAHNGGQTPLKEEKRTESGEEDTDFDIKWDDIGQSIKEGLSEVDWKSVGMSVKEGLQEVDWTKTGELIRDGVASVDWKGMGESISNGVKQVDWEEIGKSLSSAFSRDEQSEKEYASKTGERSARKKS
mmetsp:Transcript_38961/g.71981  ORF Transcript_38961/g.71981 Transcript_38961/m.71981 type:complete len:184 (-) Transcript_38961:135-686(-)|eukprot:CAMPEP_0197437860 /NCGR_PEP_ID=MMETSP1175-20131217/5001_1 /TAXON_ID=1003142 /ORGANISM="Triceratium dubium, Strain CCMP147" /LENGTH=183 /DNA_ID=CAMNT_0042967483 /DNA_START=202 /DNA_END=753 /DNA_ORIENTATION=-